MNTDFLLQLMMERIYFYFGKASIDTSLVKVDIPLLHSVVKEAHYNVSCCEFDEYKYQSQIYSALGMVKKKVITSRKHIDYNYIVARFILETIIHRFRILNSKAEAIYDDIPNLILSFENGMLSADEVYSKIRPLYLQYRYPSEYYTDN